MKTTIELPDALLDEAKRVAAGEHTTLRALIEAGLRDQLALRRQRGEFRLRDASVGGNGYQEAFRSADWSSVRDAIYEDHGA